MKKWIVEQMRFSHDARKKSYLWKMASILEMEGALQTLVIQNGYPEISAVGEQLWSDFCWWLSIDPSLTWTFWLGLAKWIDFPSRYLEIKITSIP